MEDFLNIFLLDEIFKGTNTIERISAGKAVLSALAKNNLVFVSTHDVELTDLLKDEYELYHFSEKVQEKNVDFDFDYDQIDITEKYIFNLNHIKFVNKIIKTITKYNSEYLLKFINKNKKCILFQIICIDENNRMDVNINYLNKYRHINYYILIIEFNLCKYLF